MPTGCCRAPKSLVEDAHTAGLKVHPYTFRDEPEPPGQGLRDDPDAEYLQFFRLGVDGLFSDFPDTALRPGGHGKPVTPSGQKPAARSPALLSPPT